MALGMVASKLAVKSARQIKKTETLILNELITRYAECNDAEGKSPRTIDWYSRMLTSFSGYAADKLDGDGISVFSLDTVRGFILYLRRKFRFSGHPCTPRQKELISAATVQCHIRALKAFSSWLYAEGYTAENRLKNLKLPRAPVKIIEPLTKEEIKKIGACISTDSPTGTRNYAILVMALDTGLRASEIVGIKLENINFKEGYIKVMGKGAKERIVPYGRFVQTTVWHYVREVRPKSSNGDCDNLFLSPDGKPVTANTIKLMFSRLARTSGVQRLHAHLCRHTFAINYLLNGGDIFSLREILGHTMLDMVNRYLHFTDGQIAARHHQFSPMDRLQKET